MRRPGVPAHFSVYAFVLKMYDLKLNGVKIEPEEDKKRITGEKSAKRRSIDRFAQFMFFLLRFLCSPVSSSY
jgi:hypothetical protein